jgi:hypothetical protein
LISRRRSVRSSSGELFHAFAPPVTSLDNQPDSGGPHLAFGFAPVSPSCGLLATTTSSDGNFAGGVARLHAIDLDGLDSNCPGGSNPCILASVDVAQAKLFTGVGVQGSSAVAVGDTAGFYDALSGLTGNLVISAFDVSNPSAPTLASTLVTGLVHNETEQCNAAKRLGPTRMVTLTNNYRRRRLQRCGLLMGAGTDRRQHARATAGDSVRRAGQHPRLCARWQPAPAVTASSVLVFDYTSIVGAVTASVVIPKGTGVAIVPGSFSLAPTTTITGGSSDTYIWQQPASSPITWQETVTAMQPGSSRNVVSSGSVAFTLPTLGTLSLAPAVVTSDHIVSLSPAESPSSR